MTDMTLVEPTEQMSNSDLINNFEAVCLEIMKRSGDPKGTVTLLKNHITRVLGALGEPGDRAEDEEDEQ